MRHLPMAVLAALVALTVVTSGGSPLQGQQKEARRENPLLGTWKQVSGKFNGKEFRPPEGTTLPKHVTPAQFMFVDIDKDGVIRDAAGGSYALTASTYAETNTYSIGDFHGLKERPSRHMEGGRQPLVAQRDAEQRHDTRRSNGSAWTSRSTRPTAGSPTRWHAGVYGA